MTTNEPSIIFLMGPTASGKTELAMELIQKLPCEIISVDSVMIYKGLDIGSGKPTKEDLSKAPHRLIDICEPNETYSAAQFREDAIRAIEDILKHGKVPLLVGGTMLYFKALKDGLSPLPPANKEIRLMLEEKKRKIGLEELHKYLEKVDPIAAKRIHPNDPQRILRALEIFEITGQPMSEHLKKSSTDKAPYNIIQIGLLPQERSSLHDKIALRFDRMLKNGFVEEVEKLRNREDLSLDAQSMRSVGYRQVWQFLDGQYNFQQMQERTVFATRQLAKRQMTWMRGWENLECFENNDKDIVNKLVHHPKLSP